MINALIRAAIKIIVVSAFTTGCMFMGQFWPLTCLMPLYFSPTIIAYLFSYRLGKTTEKRIEMLMTIFFLNILLLPAVVAIITMYALWRDSVNDFWAHFER